MLTKKEIRIEAGLARSLHQQLLKEIGKLPKGVLYYKQGHGAKRPYQRVDGRELYLNREKRGIIQGLNDKKQLQRAVDKLEENLQLLQQLESGYTEITDLMPDNMSPPAAGQGPIQRTGLIQKTGPLRNSGQAQYIGPVQKAAPLLSREKVSEIAAIWKTEHNGNTDYRPEERIHRTSDGICVRSKSELVIYEYLKSHGVPFVYELPVQLDDHWRYPDFTLLRQSDSRIFLWEHLGLMKDPTYYQRNIRKISEYMAEDYLPFRDMIFSFDYEDGSIDLLELDRLLRGMGFIE